MIHNIDKWNFLIFREITREESKEREEHELLHYEDSIYLYITNTPSEENAKLAIESYWRAIVELENKM